MSISRITRDFDPTTLTHGPEKLVTTHVGRVIDVFKRDYRAMSDVYTLATFALVLDENGKLQEVMVNANFECDQSQGRAEVDATAEVLAAYQRILEERERLEQEHRAARLREATERARNIPRVGKKMKVVKGRDHVGTEGTVAFVRDGRVLLKDDASWQDRKADGVWVRDTNLQAR